eukprot:Gregarina_sp_Poly_1__2691@NODE_173_length_12050_cov_429_537511_g154_i0_p4_GENE_NODE_173_length_12050_cov_429_537511_g154_i0NODE_173_length_12050_cov_429_537511_g154_i0_p4_ORF_typecomplete_len319_score18_83_NODE_173_length_12050_cov_429_537511_g154_i060096965
MPFVDSYAHMGGAVGGFLASIVTMKRCEILYSSLSSPPCHVATILEGDAAETCPPALLKHHTSQSLSTISASPVATQSRKIRILKHSASAQRTNDSEDAMTPLMRAIFAEPVDNMNESPRPPKGLERVCVHARSPVSSPAGRTPDGIRCRATASPFQPNRLNVCGHTKLSAQASMLDLKSSERRRWCRRFLKISSMPSHFIWISDYNEGANRSLSLNLAGASKVVLNPAARRSSLRRTRNINIPKGFDKKSRSLWIMRTGAFVLLVLIWVALLYLLFVCPDCYEAPGQILQMKEIHASRVSNSGQRLLAANELRRLLV